MGEKVSSVNFKEPKILINLFCYTILPGPHVLSHYFMVFDNTQNLLGIHFMFLLIDELRDY